MCDINNLPFFFKYVCVCVLQAMISLVILKRSKTVSSFAKNFKMFCTRISILYSLQNSTEQAGILIIL
jgi:hypothetical protein